MATKKTKVTPEAVAPVVAPAPEVKATKAKATKKEPKTVPVEKVHEIAEQAAKEQAPQPGQIQVNVDYLKTTKVHIAMPC